LGKNVNNRKARMWIILWIKKEKLWKSGKGRKIILGELLLSPLYPHEFAYSPRLSG
jgi:hypothetical protein